MTALLSLLLILLFISYSVEGSRPLVEFSEVAKKGESKEMVMVGAMIGSRPPNCEGRCNSCGHCEAVQVPLVPEKSGKTIVAKGLSANVNSRGDEYSSNYKPMNWKCKCGGLILNP